VRAGSPGREAVGDVRPDRVDDIREDLGQVLASGIRRARTLDLITQHRVTFMFAVPAMFNTMASPVGPRPT
jgi:hypothetical protein